MALGTGMSLQMDVGDLAPELGYLGVPGLGDYAYTHWEWGQFLRALTRGPAASTPFLSSLSFCMVATALSKPSRCCGGVPAVFSAVFSWVLRAACIRSGHPCPPLLPSPPSLSDRTSFVTPQTCSSSCCFPHKLME